MRLLFLSNVFPSPLHPTKGVFNLGLLRALAELNHDVAAVAPIAWTDWMRAARAQRWNLRKPPAQWKGITATFPVYFYPPGALRSAYGWFMWHGIKASVREMIARHRPHAIVAYWTHPDGRCAINAARQARIPAIIMVGGTDVLLLQASNGRRRAIQRVLREADAIVTVGEHLRQTIVDSGIDGRKVNVVRRGIDTDRFCPGDRTAARGRLGLPADLPIMLWVGRMEPVKGLPVLVEAAHQLKRAGLDFQLLLVGGGAMSAAISTEIQWRDLSSSVCMVGVVPHERLADYYRAANLVVLPSYSEGVPNVLLEAIACGTPFVASRVGGIPEIATPGLDRLVPSGDPRALAAAIREHLKSAPSAATRAFLPDDPPTAARRLIEIIEPLIPELQRPPDEIAAPCLSASTA